MFWKGRPKKYTFLTVLSYLFVPNASLCLKESLLYEENLRPNSILNKTYVSLLYGKSGSIKTKEGPSLQAWNTTPDQKYGADKPACYGHTMHIGKTNLVYQMDIKLKSVWKKKKIVI